MYDIMHFEALGKEADYLASITENLIADGRLPKGLKYFITPLTLQEYMEGKDIALPRLVTTKTHSVLPDDYVNSGEKKSVITRSAGYDHFEHLQSLINLATLREYCVDAVSQTAVKFLYAVCGNLNEYTKNAKIFERNNTQSFVELNKNVVATVFGVGKIGRQTYVSFRNNGLTVQAVDIREEELKSEEAYRDVHFVSREEAAQNSDIFVNVMNLTKNEQSRFYNVHYFDETYLRKTAKPLFFINMSRGEIAPERTVLKLLREGKIVGFATDVFSHESDLRDCLQKDDFSRCEDEDILAARELIDCALNRTANVYVQPHQGFNSNLAAETKARDTMEHVVYWFEHGGRGFREQLPYYKEAE